VATIALFAVLFLAVGYLGCRTSRAQHLHEQSLVH
jgi:hypothetical protein